MLAWTVYSLSRIMLKWRFRTPFVAQNCVWSVLWVEKMNDEKQRLGNLLASRSVVRRKSWEHMVWGGVGKIVIRWAKRRRRKIASSTKPGTEESTECKFLMEVSGNVDSMLKSNSYCCSLNLELTHSLNVQLVCDTVRLWELGTWSLAFSCGLDLCILLSH